MFKPGGTWEAPAASPGHQAGVGNGQQREQQHRQHEQCPAAAAQPQDTFVHQAQAQGVDGHPAETHQTRAQRDREEVQPSPGENNVQLNLHIPGVCVDLKEKHLCRGRKQLFIDIASALIPYFFVVFWRDCVDVDGSGFLVLLLYNCATTYVKSIKMC